VINIGHRPTVDHSAEAALSIEVHLLDFSADLYGKKLRVEFAERLRAERKFSSTQELRFAIAADVAQTRKLTH
jgi:riboflavin kinase/FMN adenylyltransferase